jgi:hypothetical protein
MFDLVYLWKMAGPLKSKFDGLLMQSKINLEMIWSTPTHKRLISATQSLTSTNQRIKLVTIGKTCLALGDRPKG